MTTKRWGFPPELPPEIEEERKKEGIEALLKEASIKHHSLGQFSDFVVSKTSSGKFLADINACKGALEKPSEPDIIQSRDLFNELRTLRAEVQALRAEVVKKGNPGGKTSFFTVPDFSFMLGSLIGGFGLICTGIITDTGYYSVMGAILIFTTFLHLVWLLKD